MAKAKSGVEKATAGISFWSLLGFGLGLLLLLAMLLRTTNFFVGRSLLLAYPYTESTYSGAWPTLGGDFVASNVRVLTPDMSEVLLEAERVRVVTPGWLWTMRQLFSRKVKVGPVDYWKLELEGVSSPQGFPLGGGDLDLVGAASASPFEAEGCAEDSLWLREELVQMGLSPGPTQYTLELEETDGRLVVREVIDTPGVSRAQFERTFRLGRGYNLLRDLGTPDGSALLADHYRIEDRGFVAARNRHCARKDRVAPELFHQRHLLAVRRLLEVEGLVVSPGAEAIYARFAREGGTLAFGGSYREPYDVYRYGEDSYGTSFLKLAARIESGGQSDWIGWNPVAARPFTDEQSLDPTLAVLAARGELPPELYGGTLRAPVPVAASERDGAVAATDAASPAPAPAAAAAPSGPAIDPATGFAVARRDTDGIGFEELSAHVGRTLRIYSLGRPPRVARLERVEGALLHLRAQLGGGWATYTMKREQFLRAEPL